MKNNIKSIKRRLLHNDMIKNIVAQKLSLCGGLNHFVISYFLEKTLFCAIGCAK
jgi:hypothetical protein